jgi:hypothetical protein
MVETSGQSEALIAHPMWGIGAGLVPSNHGGSIRCLFAMSHKGMARARRSKPQRRVLVINSCKRSRRI